MLNRLTKSVDLRADAKNVTVDERDNGSITAYAATFTREPDLAGDVIAKGAFTKFLARMADEGAVMPLLYNHDQSLGSFIGKVTDIREDDHGLLFTATFDGTEKAQRARELVIDGRLSKFSFAYLVRDEAPITLPDGRLANELRELDVDEVSLVLTPCNPDTSVVEVKTHETLSCYLPKDLEIGVDITYSIRLMYSSLEAPVSEGTFVGYVAVLWNDQTLGTIPLYTAGAAERSGFVSALMNIRALTESRVFCAGAIFFAVTLVAWIVTEYVIILRKRHKWDKYFSEKMNPPLSIDQKRRK